MFDTEVSVDIESLLQDSLPCENSYSPCTKEADFLLRKTYCGCNAFKCSQHTQDWIERMKDWHNNVRGVADYSRCSECHTKFKIPENVEDCFRIIPI